MIDILILVYFIGVGFVYARAPEHMHAGERIVHALKWPLEAFKFKPKK